MSKEPNTSGEPGASQNAIEALETLIDSRIESQQPTTEELARAVAPLIEIPEQDPASELSDQQLAQVREEIETRLPDTTTLTDGQIQQVIDLIGEHAPSDGGDGGDTGGDTGGSDDGSGSESGSGGLLDDATHAKIERELLRMRLASDPRHTGRIDTGVPDGLYHAHGKWGNIITVHEPVHWETAVIDAEEEGMTRLRVRRIDFEPPTIEDGTYVDGGKYELQGLQATREIHHGSGPQEIYPEITLFPGQYFVDRDPDAVVPMRKVGSGVNFDDINASHNIPVEINQSWRSVPEYTPGGISYTSPYLANEWHQNLYYFGNLEFSHMAKEDIEKEFLAYGLGKYGEGLYGGKQDDSRSPEKGG